MEFDVRTYPSRTFIRFTAHNQLVADLTGHPITATVQRLGREGYVQQVTPNNKPSTVRLDHSEPNVSFGMSVDIVGYGDNANPEHQDSNRKPEIEEMISDSTSTTSQTNGLDEALFEEIISITFNPNRYPELYQSCGTPKAAADVETRIATEIIETYKQIKLKQQCPIVQGLNGLL
jgi:hypothetical protein